MRVIRPVLSPALRHKLAVSESVVLPPIVHVQVTFPDESAVLGPSPCPGLAVPAGVLYDSEPCAFGAASTVADARPPNLPL
jgi:hypothetical protein